MGFSFPFLRANDLRTSLLITRTRILSYVGLFLNIITNAVNNNDQHVRSGTIVRMSTEPSPKTKKDGRVYNNCKEDDDYITARTESSDTTAT